MRALQLDVVAVDRVEVRVDRDLRVDDDRLAARQLHDEVGAQQRPFVVARARLRLEVAVVEHPRELDNALQLQLPPLAAHVRRAQRGDEAPRLRAQLLLADRHLAQPLADLRHLAGALLLELPCLRLELRQRLLDRRELRLRQLEQRRLALQQHVARRRLEPLLPLALALRLRQPFLDAPEPLAQPQPDGAAADEEPDHEEGDLSHGPTNARARVGRTRTKKNQLPRVRRPTGAECRIRRLRRATGSDGGNLAPAGNAVNKPCGAKVAKCARFCGRRPKGTSVRSRTLAGWRTSSAPAGRLRVRCPATSRGASRPRSRRRSSTRGRRASTSSPKPAPASARASRTWYRPSSPASASSSPRRRRRCRSSSCAATCPSPRAPWGARSTCRC